MIVRILYIADAAPVNLIAEGLIRGLRASGHEVLTYGPGLDVFYGFEVPLKHAVDIYNWRGPRFYPDVVWYSDSKFLPQWDDLDCPRVFVWVDPNCFDATHLARDADAVFIFKKQYYQAVHSLNNRTWAMPYAVDDTVYYPDLACPKAHEIVCVGTLDEERRAIWLPLREEMGDRVVIATEVWDSDLRHLYHESKVVLDWHRQNVWGDRTMMALACGVCNCTNVVPGLLDVFRPDQHIVVYEPDNLAETLEALLADDPRRERIAAEGCKEVLLRHTWRQRSLEMLGLLRDGGILSAAVKLPAIALRPDS